MVAMSRNNSTGALQGFSVSQPFLGAPLQFYPALGTPQLDDLMNAFLPGSASIKEKRATVSVDFFEYSQLTGETFKYYPVFIRPLNPATASSAGSSPNQDSGYGSNFVSPVISDWSWSQSTPGSASASTPASVAQDAIPWKAPKKAAASGVKPQNNDFSHVPGMKIMTKDGRDVTNSASRGCKTKEQRDHAHLMRIIKACEACRKKKVRCDPSHKKRAAAQPQTTTPVRSAKKAKTLAHDPPVITDRPLQPRVSFPNSSAVAQSSSESLGASDLSLELSEPWESFVQFDDEPASAIPFDYDFFFDPEGHLSPSPRQAPATPRAILSHPLEDSDLSQHIASELRRSPTLPYLDATAPASNYVDFNLFSPEPGFLDEDASLVDIGSVDRIGSSSLSRRASQGCQLAYAQNFETSSPCSISADQIAGARLLSSSPPPDGTRVFSREQLSRLNGMQAQATSQMRHQPLASAFSTGDEIVPQVGVAHMSLPGLPITFTQDDHNSLEPNPGLASVPGAASRPVGNGVSGSTSARLDRLPLSVSDKETQAVHPGGLPQPVLAATAIASRSLSHVSPAQLATRDVSSFTPASFSSSNLGFSTPLGEQSGYTMATITWGDDNLSASGTGSADAAMKDRFHSSGPQPPATRGWTPSPSSQSTPGDSDLLGRLRGPSTTVGEGIASTHRSSILQSSTSLSLLCVVLLAMTWYMAPHFAGQLLVESFFQVALGTALFKAVHTYSSLHGSRPQQSRLSSTSKLPSFSGGARLLSCFSTRLRHSYLQSEQAHALVNPAVVSTALGFA
ncbi:hypothetical protein CPLU01_01090 [Colletotrichum plurivorum]|uniref:Zn(2)-C6 fungal-type domain-containing protein n=1 Tax=Colletotrichum plurivorum TaxID=2175906 RepID=A0A8H6U4L5_9PEZI|nr:hypothetical protein CPLU01_01090 [Colletotrichum plurivorum]